MSRNLSQFLLGPLRSLFLKMSVTQSLVMAASVCHLSVTPNACAFDICDVMRECRSTISGIASEYWYKSRTVPLPRYCWCAYVFVLAFVLAFLFVFELEFVIVIVCLCGCRGQKGHVIDFCKWNQQRRSCLQPRCLQRKWTLKCTSIKQWLRCLLRVMLMNSTSARTHTR